MSKENMSDSASRAALERDRQQHQSEFGSHTANAYYAPYYTHKRNRLPDIYMVIFHPGHTIDRHFALFGHEFDILGEMGNGYGANLDDQLLNAIRYDRGVKYV